MKHSTAFAIMAGLALGGLNMPSQPRRHWPEPKQPEQTPEQAAARIAKAEAKRERRRLRNVRNVK